VSLRINLIVSSCSACVRSKSVSVSLQYVWCGTCATTTIRRLQDWIWSGVCCAGPSLWSSGQSSWLHNGDVFCFLWGTNWIYICYVEESRPLLWSSGQSSWLHNGDALSFLWGTNWIYICYVEEGRPPQWCSGQSSWLQIHRLGFDSRRYQIFWEVLGLGNREYGRRDSSRWPLGTLYLQKLALISLTSGSRLVGIVSSRTQATGFSF
jgi:hypothetical protein